MVKKEEIKSPNNQLEVIMGVKESPENFEKILEEVPTFSILNFVSDVVEENVTSFKGLKIINLEEKTPPKQFKIREINKILIRNHSISTRKNLR